MGKSGERPLKTEEQEFFRGLYRDHYRALFGYAYQLGVPREAAEDCVQETFLAAIRHIDAVRESENPRRYLNQVLKNVIGYRLRSLRYARSLQQKLREGAEDALKESFSDELRPRTLLRGAVSDGELELLIRFYLEGWSQKELAAELGISEDACKKRIKRAKKRLRSALEETGAAGSDGPPRPEEAKTERRSERE